MTTTAEYQNLLMQHAPRVIRTKTEHRRSLATIDRLMRLTTLSEAQRQLLELLSVLVEKYEESSSAFPQRSFYR